MCVCVCLCVRVCVCVHVCVCLTVCACVVTREHALKIVSMDKILRFTETFIIIIYNSSFSFLMLCVHKKHTHTHKVYIRDGRRWRKRENIYLLLHGHYQNDSCIKVGSDENHCNVSSVVRDKVSRQCPQTTTIFDQKGEPKRNRPRPFCLPV